MKIDNKNHGQLRIGECYARIVLETMLPQIYKGLEISNLPDLIDKNNNVGIEVTGGYGTKEYERQSYLEKFYKASGESREKNRAMLHKLGAEKSPKECDGFFAWPTISYGSHFSENPHYIEFHKAVESKVDTLAKGHYQYFKQYELFVEGIHCLPQDSIKEMFESLKAINIYPYSFRKIYYCSTEQLYCFDFENNKFEIISGVKQGEWSRLAYQESQNTGE